VSTVAADRLMTIEEFEALPEEPGVERMLIRGVLWESSDVTARNKWHTAAIARISRWIDQWIDLLSPPFPVVASGEAGCRLKGDPGTRVGIDVAVFSADVAQMDVDDQVIFAGAPILAVEILSPSDKQEEIQAKIDEYLACGVKLVWIVDTHFRTVVVHRPDGPPEMFHGDEELVGDPHLPGLRVRVEQLFSR
jgi:Uma2 family endonuclease